MPEYQDRLKHKNTYGGVNSVSVLEMTLVIFHDKQAAHDLLGQAMRYTREFLRNRKSSHQDWARRCWRRSLLGVRRWT